MTDHVSPLIVDDAWGTIRVGERTYHDVKVWPGGCREWDWTEHGTSHVPGVAPAEPDELVEGGARVVVVSTGRAGRLGVPEATLARLRERGVETEVLTTPEAVERYNSLARGGVAVGALIHTTC
jgi:hypothetical protein